MQSSDAPTGDGTSAAAAPTSALGVFAGAELVAGARGSHRATGPTGSWLDDLWSRWTATPALRRRTEWILIGAITLVALLVRTIALGHPRILVFDETFYVKDAWSLVHLGYEAAWPDDANDGWAAGMPGDWLDSPSYVVHPPFGKYLIGLGMLLFGTESAFGWRIAVATIGTLAVPLLYWVAKLLFRSIPLASIAAAFLAIDGHAIVTSRISVLDGPLMFFGLLGFLLILYDRRWQRRRLADFVDRWKHAGHDAPPRFGPVLWNRPWLVAAAVVLALASSIKWSGAYFLAAFCLYAVIDGAFARHRLGIRHPIISGIFAQGPAAFLITIPLAILVYLATWTGWFVTDGGYYRTWAEEAGNAWNGALSWVPLPLQSFWHYQSEVAKFHMTLSSEHPYNSAPYQWPFLLRPTAFSYVYSNPEDDPSCHVSLCVEAITSISNPLIFWFGTISIVFLIMMLFVRRHWQHIAILVGYAAGYGPWLINGIERASVYHFYAIAFLPYMILASLAAIETIAGSPTDSRRSRTAAINVLVAFMVVIVLVSALFLPVWTGIRIPGWYWELTHWLPGWK